MDENGGDLGGSPGGKPWERSWSTDEMRQNAHSWNLACDAGLLKHLQEFSQVVLARTHTTEKALDSLIEEVNTLTSDVNTTNNKFLCLANTQFVENRVYEDDDKETPQDEPVSEKKSKEETEAKMLQKVREALSMSVAVLDTMFEPVEIQASDSESESDTDKLGSKTLLLEPHNPYIHRPLPHLIGSEAFMSDDRIGLDNSPSDGEEEFLKTGEDYDMEASSESDVDFTPFSTSKRNRDLYSSQSSVSDHGPHPAGSEQRPKKIKPGDLMKDKGGDGGKVLEEEQPSSSLRHQVQDNVFAAQLAAKLDKIASPATNSNSEKNSGLTKTTSDDLFGGGHSEDEDDALFAGSSGLFSGRPKLFDDLEDTNNSLWGPEPGNPTQNIGTEKSEQPNKPQTKLVVDNLFSSNVSDGEDDLFSIKAAISPRVPSGPKPHLGEQSSSTLKQPLNVGDLRYGIMSSTPERGSEKGSLGQKEISDASGNQTNGINNEVSKKVSTGVEGTSANEQLSSSPAVQGGNVPARDKKPAGGVPMFGQANILAGLKAKFPHRPPSSSSESSTGDPPDSESLPTPQSILPLGRASQESSSADSQSASIGFSSPALTSTKISDDRYQKKNVSNSISSIPTASSHDDDIGDDDDDIFGRKPPAFSSQYIQPTSGGLFSDIYDDEDDLFAVSPPPKREEKKQTPDLSEKSVSINKSKEDVGGSTTPKREIDKPAQPDVPKTSTTTNSFKSNSEKNYLHDIYSTVPPPLKSESKLKKPVSLFDDSDSGEDELLFSSASSAGSRRSQASTDILTASATSSIEKKPLSKKGLFDDDDALFGSTRNDPDIDIFGSSKGPAQSSTLLGASQPLSNPSLVEEDSIENDSGSVMQSSSILSTGNADPTVPVKTSVPEEPKSLFCDDLFADADNNDDGSDLFSGKSQLFAPSGSDSIEDDLFQHTTGGSSNLGDYIETKQPSNVMNSRPQEQDGMSNNAPTFNAHQARPPKQSLLVENTNIWETEEKLTAAAEKDSAGSVKPLSIKADPSPLSAHQQNRKPEPPRTLNIKKETDPGVGFLCASDDDDNDLFSSSGMKVSPKPAPPPKQPVKPTVAAKPESSFTSKPQVLTAHSGDQSMSKSLDEKVTANIKPELSEVDGATVSVSKLRNSLLAGGNGQLALKIDPRALLPGQKPPSRQTPPKEVASGRATSGDKELPVPSTNEPAGFDQPMQNSATLPSTNKDRAKLGVKRRPPSSKARREAARASQNFDQSDKESPLSPDLSSTVTDPSSTLNVSVTSSNSILSPSTDEDDLFGVPQDLPPEYGNQIVTTADIFSGAPILSPIAPENTRSQPETNKAADISEKKTEASSSTLKGNTSIFLPPEETDEELFAPMPRVVSEGLVNERMVTPGSTSPSMLNPPKTLSQVNVDKSNLKKLLSTSDVPQLSPSCKTNKVDDFSVLLSSEGGSENSISSAGEITDGVVKPTLVEADKTQMSTVKNAESATSSIDPLNKVDEPPVNDEDELFETENSAENIGNHSALFPFVKKKPEIKQGINQPLFTQTPALPSKADKSVPKPDLGGLDDVEDNDLFATSSKPLSGQKSEDASKLKSKEAKRWNFSDEDDDDLFQSKARVVPSKLPTASASVSASASIPSPSVPVKSKDTIESSKPPVSEVNVKKMKPMQSRPNGLFSEENDEDDDLFSKPSQFSRNKVKGTTPGKSSLFDDDDDDLFGTNQASSKNKLGQSKPKPAPETSAQPSATSKPKKEDVFDDPLMALQND